MDSVLHVLVPIVIIAVLVLVNGLFVAAEFAIVGVPRTAIEKRAAEGDRIARIVHHILHDPRRQDQFIATAQLGITIASLGLGMYGEHVLADWIHHGLEALHLPSWLAAHAVATLLAVAVLTYFHVVLGEMIPKSLALQQAERTVLAVATPMLWIKGLFYPLVIALNAMGNGVLRLMGVNPQAESAQFHTAEELEYVVRESAEGGLLRAETGDVLRELFAFPELRAEEVMVPRVRISGVRVGMTPDEVREMLRASRHTRYPVVAEDLDHITGMVHIKDLLRCLLKGQPIQAADVRPVPYVPATATLDQVLAAMEKTRTLLAVVMDEHGGTAGLVTIQDLFEEVVGDMEENPAVPREIFEAEGRLHVAGTVRIEEVGEALDQVLEHEEVDTVSGLVLCLLGRPPVVGDTVEYDRVRFTVTGVTGHGVTQCTVEPIVRPPD